MLTETFSGRRPEVYERVEELRPFVYNFARKLTGDPVLAEDIAQEALISAWRSYDSIRTANLKSWLGSIVLNKVRQYNRVKKNKVSTVEISPNLADGFDLESTIEKHTTLNTISRAVDALPLDYRVPLLLWMDDVPFEEIAKFYGLKNPTAKTRVFRAREIVREQLQADGYLNPPVPKSSSPSP